VTRQFCIIANPTSGKGRGRKFAERIRESLIAAGCDARVSYTQGPGHAEQIARDFLAASNIREAETRQGPTIHRDVIVACGGDGTIQQIANVLANARCGGADPGLPTFPDGTQLGHSGQSEPRQNGAARLSREGIIGGYECPIMALAPCGRCNDFARAFGVRPDPEQIVDTLLNDRTLDIDLGRINGRYFCTIATVGIDAEISSFVDRAGLLIKGTPAYLYAAVRTLVTYKPKEVCIRGDFGEIRQHVFLASTANTHSYGGAIKLVPQADPADGKLHVCIIDAVSRLKALSLIPKTLTGRHVHEACVHFHETRSLTIDSAEPLDLWADGERIASTPARIEVVPGAIRILAPP